MNIFYYVSAVFYILVILVFAWLGLRFLFASRIMPYHLVAMETDWQKLITGQKVMLLNFMKSAGAGFITTAVASMLILIIFFLQNNVWAKFGVPGVLLIELVLMIFRVIDVKNNSKAEPPLGLFVIMICLTICGLVFSLF